MRIFSVILISVSLLACARQSSTSTAFSSSTSGIMGGRDLKEGEPLAQMIVALYDIKGGYLCSGALLSEEVVVTAAHCIEGKAANLRVIFGTDAFGTLEAREVDIQKEFVRRGVATIVHEQYNSNNESDSVVDVNDIALVRFSGGLPQGFHAASILKDSQLISKGTLATVAGYGVNHITADPVDAKKISAAKLKEGIETGEILCDDEQKECLHMESDGSGYLRAATAQMKIITKSEVRLDESKGQGTCSGDSGGPAFVQKEGQYYVFGVTSRGNLLCNEEGVYTSLVAHQAWIEKSLAKWGLKIQP